MDPSTKPPHHPSPSNLDIARRYLDVLGDPASTPGQLEALLAPDVIAEELPSLIAPRGRTRDRPAMLQGFAAGKNLLASQDYTVVNAFECRETVILEVRWRGVLAQGFGSLAPGMELRARFAMFLELRDGKIAVQRNYDCYEPLGS
jgi:ketosteroid isomerase-like protein